MSSDINFPDKNKCSIAIIGIGYVGLPLAIEFAKDNTNLRTGMRNSHKVIGFDINEKRIQELKKGFDITREATKEELESAIFLEFTSDPQKLIEADIFILSVPTPINESKEPDLIPLKLASELIGKVLKNKNAINKSPEKTFTPIIIFESTVFPGATEEICIPIIENISNLKFNYDFVCGYSPERINPGDNQRKLTSIKKVTSGSTLESANWIDDLYGSIIKAGTHKAQSIKVAEAAKIIENTQRDLNIALMNELSIIFDHLNIDTRDVLKAASTKWNFLNFSPGLVGGHCIGVDPYYLTWKSKKLGYTPEIVLAGRKINDGMSKWIAYKLINEMKSRKINIEGSRVLILGITFKENCPDLRNSKVIDLINILTSKKIAIDLIDPLVESEEINKIKNIKLIKHNNIKNKYVAVIAAVSHSQFINFDKKTWSKFITKNGILIDVKGIIPRSLNPIRI